VKKLLLEPAICPSLTFTCVALLYCNKKIDNFKLQMQLYLESLVKNICVTLLFEMGPEANEVNS
jgi:hypothetical protein